MCGIFGYVLPGSKIQELDLLNNQMCESLHHRGPDDNGVYQKGTAAIANTRLSIIDLTGGHQPVESDDGNIVVVQNGEIYNYIEVRNDLILKGYSFNTESDTEVILKAYIEWGTSFINKLNGMFAIAIIDNNSNKLLIYRDRLGVKPLYIYQNEDKIMFASEIKSFLKYKNFNSEINEQAICDYLIMNYVPLPQTIYKYVSHLEPGHFATISLEKTTDILFKKYWDIDIIEEDHDTPIENYEEQIENILEDAVNIRLRSDVEVGAFLSGGLDSSLVTALMRKVRPNDKISTYSIGFKEKEFDESEYAIAVSNKYNLKNHLFILEGDIINYWNKVTFHNDQPHGDISFIPTYILSKFTSEDLKVVLTGDGGDELFAGYLKYLELEKQRDVNTYFNNSSVFNPSELKGLLTEKFQSKVDVFHSNKLFNTTLESVKHKDLINQILYFEVKQLLPGNNLVKPDKMAMANSLETRSPFLDYRLFELTSKIPGNLKLRNGDTKHILKKIGLKYFNEEHVYRKKQMFTVPIGEWFKDKLKWYLLDIVQSDSLRHRGIFNNEKLVKMANDHISGIKNYTRELRAIVNLELWFRTFIDR